ncbi:NAD(P)/FAD-dependent oxidoreductase [Domibacillus robiginosus]|uniref:NAD(P)/FAD-dependent oxidoreductase n=1 Tax=Domibacillus robiginosus TaxID=1071054 RepID=UPI00067D3617|nr:NAD(P)/FAD-dependent oxidoreductase [Domibacillus robiginosus]
MPEQDIYDVTIIGGGPAGLYSAFYSGLRGMKTKIIEYQPRLGGKIHVYPEKLIWDIGGLTPITGDQLIKQLEQQALTFNPDVVLNEKIERIQKNNEGIFELFTASKTAHFSKTVIAAVGSGILNPQKLPIEGAERFEVTNLHYVVQSIKKFKDKTVVISGGGNSAVDWANELTAVAEKVYVVYRGNALKGHEAQVEQLMNSSAICLMNESITKLIASSNGEKISQIELTNSITMDKTILSADEVVINHGFDRDSTLLQNSSSLDIKLEDDFYVASRPSGESSVPGFFAAGDVLKHDGKLHLIAGAFQDAANAVNRAKQFIDPESRSSAMVSSHNDVFKEKNKKIMQKLIQQ